MSQSLDSRCEYKILTLAYANDVCAGVMDNMSEQAQLENFREEVMARQADRLNYRYPGVGGESYLDLIARGNELTCLLEQSRGNSIVVCDRAMYRVLLGYFTGKHFDEIPDIAVKGGVLELARTDTGFKAIQHKVERGRATSSAGRYKN